MEKKGKKHIRIVRLFAWALGVIFLLLASLPVWFPWIAQPLLEQAGLNYQRYERIGATAFELRNARAQWDQTKFHAANIYCVLPTTWGWRKLSGYSNGMPFLLISNGVLSVSSSTNSTSRGAGQTLDEIQKAGFLLTKYAPFVRLTNCVIDLPEEQLLLPDVRWRNRHLRGQFRSINWAAPIFFDAGLASHDSLTLSLDWKANSATLLGTFTRETNVWNWRGKLTWMTNHADVAAQFTTNDWWPVYGVLNASQFCVPADVLRLNGYQALTTSLAFHLATNQFSLQATGFALPTSFARNRGLPAIHGSLRLTGNPESVTLEQFQLQAPFGRATLTNALGIKRTGQLKNLAARLQLSVNLSRLPGLSLAGTASGEVRVQLPTNRQPVAYFNIAGTNVGAFGVKAQSARLDGNFSWPWLSLDHVTVQLADGSELKADGGIDLSTRELQPTHWQFKGGFLNQFLDGFHYQNLDASGIAQGALTNLTQTGNLTLDNFAGGWLRPVHAQATWKAAGWKLTSTQCELAAGNSVLSAAGSFDLSAARQHKISGTLQAMSLRQNDRTLYSLQQPCSIFFHQSNTNGFPQLWQARMDHFDWQDSNNIRNLSLNANLQWPRQGSLQLKIRNATPDDFTNFVQNTIGKLELAHLELTANWSNSPVQWTNETRVTFHDHSGHVFTVQGELDGGKQLTVHELTLNSELAPPVNITGTLPVQIIPSATNGWLTPNYQTALHLEADAKTGTNGLPLSLGSLGSWRLTNANFHVQATGTLATPSIAMTLGIQHLRWQSKTNDPPHPRMDDLKVEGVLTNNLFQLNELAFHLDDQSVSLSGRWPLPDDFWKTIRAHPKSMTNAISDWRKASGQMRIQNAQLSAVSRYVPETLALAGRFNANISLTPGGRVEGFLTVSNASTRFQGPLAPVRDISARLRFNGSEAVLEDCHGLLGEQPLLLSGRATFPANGPLRYQVHLTGTNLPMVRQLEFLLRGDVDLTLQNSTNATTSLTGNVTLRHGLYVRYLSDLIWSGPKQPAPAPPYFSITNQPFAGWKLGVDIKGNQFLHVQTPVFACLASVDANVSGTLKTPVFNGTSQINSGQIRFPFGTLDVTEGSVNLNGNNPAGPNLEFHASGMAYDYEVHLDITGPANNANVQFSSTPPLNSEEILLLLTAGQLPQNEYSFSTEARAGRLATFLGKDWLGRFTGNTGGRPRWIIRSGEHISEQGRLTYSVEYRITDRWSIIGEYDQYDQYNANLKWRIISR